MPRLYRARVHGALSLSHAPRHIFSSIYYYFILCPVEIQKTRRIAYPPCDHFLHEYMIALLIDGYVFVLMILWKEPFHKGVWTFPKRWASLDRL